MTNSYKKHISLAASLPGLPFTGWEGFLPFVNKVSSRWSASLSPAGNSSDLCDKRHQKHEVNYLYAFDECWQQSYNVCLSHCWHDCYNVYLSQCWHDCYNVHISQCWYNYYTVHLSQCWHESYNVHLSQCWHDCYNIHLSPCWHDCYNIHLSQCYMTVNTSTYLSVNETTEA